MVAAVVPAVVGDLDSFDLAAEQAKMSDEAARAFVVFLGLPERKLRDVATHVGKRDDLVREWSVRYGWRELARRFDLAVSNQLMVQLRSTLVLEGVKSIGRVLEIRDAEIDGKLIKAGDVLKAAFWVASLTGIGAELAQGDGGTGGAINADDLRRLATSGDPEDLKRLVKLTTGGDQ